MERRDLYQDDLTEERYPSPARRDDAAASQVLDPDTAGDGIAAPSPRRGPAASTVDPETDDDNDDDEDEEDDEDDED